MMAGSEPFHRCNEAKRLESESPSRSLSRSGMSIAAETNDGGFCENSVDVKLRPHTRSPSRLLGSDFFCCKTTVSRN